MIRLLLAAIRWLATPPAIRDHSYDPTEDAALDALTAWVRDLTTDPVDQHYTTTVIALDDGLLHTGLDLIRALADTDNVIGLLEQEGHHQP